MSKNAAPAFAHPDQHPSPRPRVAYSSTAICDDCERRWFVTDFLSSTVPLPLSSQTRCPICNQAVYYVVSSLPTSGA